MSKCKVCGKKIPDGKSICNNCRIEQMYAANNRKPETAAEKSEEIKEQAQGIKQDVLETTSMFSSAEQGQEHYREPSMQPYVKYNGIDKGERKESNNFQTTMFSHTGAAVKADEPKEKISREHQADINSSDVIKRTCGICSSYLFLAACVLYSLFCLFSLFDAIAKMNPVMLLVFLFNFIILVNLWIIFIKARFKKNFSASNVRNLRRFSNAKYVLYIMTAIFMALGLIVIAVILKYEIVEENIFVEPLSYFVFVKYTADTTLGSLVQPAILIYAPVFVLVSIYYAYLIKFLHAVFVNSSNGKVMLNYTLHASIALAVGIFGKIFAYLEAKAALEAVNSILGPIVSAISAAGLPVLGTEQNFGIPKLIFSILSTLAFIAIVLAYRFTVTNKEEAKKIKIFRLFSE